MTLRISRLVPALFSAGLALSWCLPAATLLVLNKEGNLAFIDPATVRVEGRVPVGFQPHEVTVSTDGKLAFVSNYGSGPNAGHTLSVIDVASRKELHRVELAPLRRPHGVAFFGGKLYFTAEDNKVVGRYDPLTNQVDEILGTGQGRTHMVRLSKDGSRIYCANISGDSISIFENRPGPDGWVQTVVPTGKGPEGFDVLPDESELWAANSQDGHVTVIDLAAKRVKASFDVATKRSNRLEFTPDGKTALVSDLGAGDLIVVDVATHAIRKRIPLGAGLAGTLITPDGARAYVAATGANKVFIVDLHTLAVTGNFEPGKEPDGMAWVK